MEATNEGSGEEASDQPTMRRRREVNNKGDGSSSSEEEEAAEGSGEAPKEVKKQIELPTFMKERVQETRRKRMAEAEENAVEGSGEEESG
jgi:hypothetical protein